MAWPGARRNHGTAGDGEGARTVTPAGATVWTTTDVAAALKIGTFRRENAPIMSCSS